MKIGILGGSFDPVHIGHLRLAIEAKEKLKLEKVYLETSYLSPFKKECFASPETRLEMVASAIEGLQGIELGTHDIHKKEKSYSINMLKHYAAIHKDIFLIMGSDTLSGFPNWKQPEEIIKIATLAVATRQNENIKLIIKGFPKHWHNKILTFPFPTLEVSSTMIREKISKNESIDYLTPQSVVGIIKQRSLYTGGKN